MQQRNNFYISVIVCTILLLPGSIFGQSADELKRQIADTNSQIEAIQKEINRLAPLVDTSLKQTQTLQNALNTLELTNKKLNADLQLTTGRITKTSLTLTDLSKGISAAESKINLLSKAVSENMRTMQVTESQSVMEQMLSQKSLSETWNQVNALVTIQESMRSGLKDLQEVRADLAEKRATLEKERGNLLTLQKDLSGQKQAVEANKNEQAKRLAQAKNDVTAYQTELNKKIQERKDFEKELFETESRLKITIDPSSIPNERSGIISWPLSDVYITQKFGATVDSKRLYVSGTHNGIDFRAAIGTPIKSVLTGIVQATGNTDIQKNCYSYGKWVLIKHPNGISSLYAHLSVISVNPGDTVETGSRIGYSGNTGYSTGPHLHLGLFATQGMKVEKYVNSNYCKQTVIPIADVKAYLDPLAYLPGL